MLEVGQEGEKDQKYKEWRMEFVERKYSKYFKNLARKIKRNGYKIENVKVKERLLLFKT